MGQDCVSNEQDGWRDEATRRGVRLLLKTLVTYRRETMLSIGGAVLWMSLVVIVPLITASVFDDAILAVSKTDAARQTELIRLVQLLVLAGVLKAAGVGGRRFFGFLLAYRAETDLRNRIYEHTQRLAFAFHDRVSTGELMAKASSDLSQVRLVFMMLPVTVANVGMFVVVISVMISLNPVLGAIVSLAIPLLLFIGNTYARRVIALSYDVQERIADMSSVVEEAITGIRVVKSYGAESFETSNVHHAATGIFDKSIALTKQRSIFVPLFESVAPLATITILALGGLYVLDGSLSEGDFFAFMEYMVILNFPLRITGWFFAELPRSAAAGARVMDLLATAPDIADPAEPALLPAGRGEIRFRDVAFSYPDGPPVLRQIDARIPAGSSVAIVGATGSGKSTMSYLIPRFYDVSSGSICIDGVDIRDVSVEELRSQVALVFEETFLFSASIADNIAFGAPDATEEQIRLSARLAQADGFISELAQGYDTMVGERGYSLSGGQRQRIALARAVLRDPRVLILDDATSSVDAVTENEIREALKTVMQGRTTVIIAHRPSTLALADSVIFVDEGAVAAAGSHDMLLATNDRYREVLASTHLLEEGV